MVGYVKLCHGWIISSYIGVILIFEEVLGLFVWTLVCEEDVFSKTW